MQADLLFVCCTPHLNNARQMIPGQEEVVRESLSQDGIFKNDVPPFDSDGVIHLTYSASCERLCTSKKMGSSSLDDPDTACSESPNSNNCVKFAAL
jgi:hypothetical protein